MAKDPAMLWYWSDWNSGTSLFSRFLKGCYMDVLHAQFNHGRLSLEEIKICLGPDFGTAWPTLQKKFRMDENSLFFNERLELEKNKRAAFTASRRNNLPVKNKEFADISTHISDHIIADMENENRNENIDTVLNLKSVKEKKEVYGTYENIKLKKSEYERLEAEIGTEDTNACIEHLSSYKREKGYKTKDDNLTIRRWVIDAVNDKKIKGFNNGTKNGSQNNNTHNKLRSAHAEAQRLLAEDLAESNLEGEGSD